jgi:acetylglutamate kinase
MNTDSSLVNAYKGKIVLVKYGGNAMLNEDMKHSVLDDICQLIAWGVKPVIVHGGGPFINELLEKVGVESEFVDGHRRTTDEALMYIEMALKGRVNSELVRMINGKGQVAVGLSGKDGKMVLAKKRIHTQWINGKPEQVDLKQVGDVSTVNTRLINILLKESMIPVIASIAGGEDGKDYNVNADMFAGHVAGALGAEAYVALTNVDGLMENPQKPETLVREIDVEGMKRIGASAIQGGMIPKMESCFNAISQGVKSVRIINGMKPRAILQELFTHERSGTLLR